MADVQTSSTRTIQQATEMRAMVVAGQRDGESVGFVPTMGALHAGHLSLVDAALAECDRTVVSIFVNPTQFGPGEDLQRYPRLLQEDLELLSDRGCWLAFAPNEAEVYKAGHETYVEVGSVAKQWEGSARPTHFRGVATIVLKLLHIVPADVVYFGQKDYQQTLVVERMIEDLNLPTKIRVCPIVREADGLAMSSRNQLLSAAERKQAGALWQSLKLAEELHNAGETDSGRIRAAMQQMISAAEDVELDYIGFFAQGSLREVPTVRGPTVVAVAAKVGTTRLIDNHTLS